MRQYSQIKDPVVKTCINQLQKQIKDGIRIETQSSWEKFCNCISLETNQSESLIKIKNFFKPTGHRTLRHDLEVMMTKSPRQTQLIKTQLFVESAERHFVIESDNFDSNHFNEVNQFVEDNHKYFHPPEDSETTDLTWEMIMSL